MKPLIILTGPTAVGKTELSIKLAKSIGGEIISADSMQVYKKMNIGTAKIMPEEMDGIKHYLIDDLDPSEDFNVFLFKNMAKKAVEEIYSNGHIPIVTGGTGFYIQALLYDIDFTQGDADYTYREELESLAKEKGVDYVHNMLRAVDPESADAIHANNLKRVIRALEYYKITKVPISKHNKEQKARKSPYNFLYFVLNDDRKLLYDRIDQRVDKMLSDGLLEEVKSLMDEGYDRKLVSMQGLGYKEIIAYYNNEMSLEEAVYVLKRDTRHFAKRQLTWFNRESDVTMINRNEFDGDNEAILEYMLNMIKEKLNDNN